jgi:hypothetical protein
MLKIAESNGETSNNSIRLVAAILAINIAKLVATTLIILIAAAPLKLAIAAPLKRSAYKAARGCAASGASWSNCIKGVLGELVNLMVEKF